MKKKVLSFIELVQKENYILYQAEEARKYQRSQQWMLGFPAKHSKEHNI